MKKLFQNSIFMIGFWSGIILFLILNIFPRNVPTGFAMIITERGFPFLAFREGLSSNYSSYVFWWGLFADITIALTCSFLIGLSLKFIKSKISLGDPTLK